MPRRPSFRRDSDLQQQLRKTNKLVQNKQSRLRVNKGLEVEGVSTVKPQEFGSRREVEKYLKQMDSFLQKKADFRVQTKKGTSLNYGDVQEVEKVIRRVNRQKAKQWDAVKDLPYRHRGQETNLTVAQQANPTIGMGDPKFADLKMVKFDVDRFRSESEFLKYKEDKEKLYTKDFLKKQNELYRENYLKAMSNQLGETSRELQWKIQNMPIEDFIKMYYSENNAHINFVYDKLAAEARMEELERIWEM